MEELFEFDLSDVDVAAFESVVTPASGPLPNEAQVQIPISNQAQTIVEEQISNQIEDQSTDHNHHTHHHQHYHHIESQDGEQQEQLQQQDSQPHNQNNLLHDKVQHVSPPPALQQQSSNQPIQIQLQHQKHQLSTSQQIQLQQQLQHHQIAATTGQQPCKILLIPINSAKAGTPGLKSDCFIPGLKNLIQIPQGSSPLPISTLRATAPNTSNSINNHTVGNNTHNSSSKKNHLSNNIQFSHSLAPVTNHQQTQSISSSPNLITSEVPKRKPCNCTKSQCLKLYCDCFANGEFCSGCNCKDCYNSLSKEKERQKAISQCLERNPEAFRPKIGKAIKGASVGEPMPESIERRHTKGCNCKRSGCLKNYCECYEAKILCSNLCKCCGCKNYEESFERKSLMQLANSSSDTARGILKSLLPINTTSSSSNNVHIHNSKLGSSTVTTKNFINKEVINASLVCLLQSAQQAEKDGIPPDDIPNLIQTEMGRCLRMIVNSIANESAQGPSTKKRWTWDKTR